MEKESNNQKDSGLSRRKLLGGVISAGAVCAASVSGIARADTKKPTPAVPFKKGSVIVFQGDSITDGGRKRKDTEANSGLGRSYPALIAGLLHGEFPEHELKIYNRGISGNKVPDLAARWKNDVLDLKPDILSIMVGVNDYWHTIAFGSKYKGTVADYEEGYRKLIAHTQNELPHVSIVICDPFTFRDWPAYKPYQKVAKKLADEFSLTYVPFQTSFDQLVTKIPKNFWLWDGVHPTIPGYAQMAKIWRKTVGI